MSRLERSGVLLAGGRSSRMGRPKALLDLAGAPLVLHVARPLLATCDEIVLVLAPRVPDDGEGAAIEEAVRAAVERAAVERTPADRAKTERATTERGATERDARGPGREAAPRFVPTRDSDEPFRGPVAGLAAGLAAARGRLAAVVACDTPLLARALLEGLFALAESPAEPDVVLPVRSGRPEPLLAVYRVATAAPHFARRLARGGGRPTDGLDELRVRTVEGDELRALDPDESSFLNVNSPDEYAAARALFALRPRAR